jgi:hypothetical protein
MTPAVLSPPRPARPLLPLLLSGLTLAVTFGTPIPVHAHSLERPGNGIAVDLATDDGRDFSLVLAFHVSVLETYAQVARDLGLPVDADRHALAEDATRLFSFGTCQIRLAPVESRFQSLVKGAFLGVKMRLTCPAGTDLLSIRRVHGQEQKTRGVVYIALRVQDRPPQRLLVPPSSEGIDVPLDGGRATLSGERKARQLRKVEARSGSDPSEPLPIQDFPVPGGGSSLAALWPPPPWPMLRTWAVEGALHLALGPDHLLFLLTLVLGAAGYGRLLLAVLAFSLGHLTSMALGLVFNVPPPPWLDVVIGGTIATSAWLGRDEAHVATGKLVALTTVFGLIHGLGFGGGLRELVGGLDTLAWPLVSFGLGLDLAQMTWVTVGFAAWWVVRRQVKDSQHPQRQARVHALVAWALMLAGVGAGAYGAVRWLG